MDDDEMMGEHPIARLIGQEIKVTQADHPRVWSGELVEFAWYGPGVIVLHVIERGEEAGRDIIMPLSSVTRLWRA